MSKEIESNGMEMTKEEKNGFIRKYEDDILGGLLAAGAYKDDDSENKTIQIIRQGAVVLEFRVRPVSEEENAKYQKRNSTYKRNKVSGEKIRTEFDRTRYRSQLIYEATVDEDREKIWDNKAAWNKFAVLNGIDLIDCVLKAGEKERIIDTISEISGFGEEPEDTAKN